MPPPPPPAPNISYKLRIEAQSLEVKVQDSLIILNNTIEN